MDSIDRFTTKAERYALYRWGYAPEAIQAIFDLTGLDSQAIVADVGSGTGLVTQELVRRVRKIYAIEPNKAMRVYAEGKLSPYPSFVSVDGKSEATTLPDACVDLITAGQAIHWFEPKATLREFRRILKPGGWLAALFHKALNLQSLSEAVKAVCTVENGWDTTPTPSPKFGGSHTDYYFGTGIGTKGSYPQLWQETWDVFLGGILSDSHSPDDTHPAFTRLVSELRRVFDHYSDNGCILVSGGTEIVVGQLRKEGL